MSLDVAVIGEDGTPRDSVAIGVTTHSKLMRQASAQHLPILLRLSNYYGDAMVDAVEVPGFLGELDRVRASTVDADVLELAGALRELAGRAIAPGRHLEAIAD